MIKKKGGLTLLPFQAWKTLCVCVMEKKKRKGLTSDDNPNRSLATEELMTHYNKGSRAISGLTSLDDGSGVLYSASSCDATDERTIVSSSLSLSLSFSIPCFFSSLSWFIWRHLVYPPKPQLFTLYTCSFSTPRFFLWLVVFLEFYDFKLGFVLC